MSDQPCYCSCHSHPAFHLTPDLCPAPAPAPALSLYHKDCPSLHPVPLSASHPTPHPTSELAPHRSSKDNEEGKYLDYSSLSYIRQEIGHHRLAVSVCVRQVLIYILDSEMVWRLLTNSNTS